MRKKLIVAALTASIFGGGAALAAAATNTAQDAPAPRGPGGPLLHADANKDGIVTRDEVLADVAARFAKVDTDKNGQISKEERKAAREAMGGRPGRMGGGRRGWGGPEGAGPEGAPPRMAKRGDANGDGVLTLEEQQAQALKMFGFADRNSDGQVDQAEREQMREMMMAMRGPGKHGKHGRHGPPPPAGSPN